MVPAARDCIRSYGVDASVNSLDYSRSRPVLCASVRSVLPRFLIPVIVCLAMFSLWVVRDYRVTGTPFGISPFAFANGIGLSESAWMRDPQPDMSRLNFSDFRRRAQSEFSFQLGSLFALLGGVMVAPIYFVSLLHPFKRGETERFQMGACAHVFFCVYGTFGLTSQL